MNGMDFSDYMRKIDTLMKHISETKNRRNVTEFYENEEDFVDVE